MNDSKLFLLGNGPSLRGFDFHRLNAVSTIGMNVAYRHWDRIKWYPTYYCCMDTTVILSHADQINRLIEESDQNGIQKFFLRQNILEQYPHLQARDDVFFLEVEWQNNPLLQARYITTGAQSALWGAFLGYSQIYLLGIDLNYVERIAGAKLVLEGEIVLVMEETPSHNPNYFFDDYQQIGDRFNIPNHNPEYPTHTLSWQEVKDFLHKSDVMINNCNLHSNLVVFPYLSLDDALMQPERPLPDKSVYRQLNVRHNQLSAEHHQLRTEYNQLSAERDHLRTEYNQLSAERDHLRTEYNQLSAERDHLSANTNLMLEKQNELNTLKGSFKQFAFVIAKKLGIYQLLKHTK